MTQPSRSRPGTRRQSLTLFVAAGRRSPCRAGAPLARVTNARVGASSCLVFRGRVVQRAYHGIDWTLVRRGDGTRERRAWTTSEWHRPRGMSLLAWRQNYVFNVSGDPRGCDGRFRSEDWSRNISIETATLAECQ